MTKGKPKELTVYQKIARAKIPKFKREIDLATTNKSESVHAGPNKIRGKKGLEIEKMPSQEHTVDPNKSHGKKALEIEKMPSQQHTVGPNKLHGKKALKIEKMPSQEHTVDPNKLRGKKALEIEKMPSHQHTVDPNKLHGKKALEIEKMLSHQHTVDPNKLHGKKALEIEKMPSQQHTVDPNKLHGKKALEIEKMPSQEHIVDPNILRGKKALEIEKMPRQQHTVDPNKSRGKKAMEIEKMPSQQRTVGLNKSRGKKATEIEKMPSQQQNVNREVERDNSRRDMHLPEMEEFDLKWGEDSLEGEGDTSEGLNHPQKKKHRGPTKLNYLKNRPCGKKMIVDFNIKGQPVGPNSVLFSSYIGKIARDRVPISFRTWHKIPKGKSNIKDKMWDSIKKKFVPEYAKKQTLKMIGKNWRGRKTKLRSMFYDAYDNDEDRVAHCPPNVKLVDWKAFVAYTSSDEYTKLREIGRKAVANHKMPHTTSRKGFSRLEDELVHKNDGVVPVTRSTVWVAGHIKKNGEPVNEYTKGKIDLLNEMNSSTEYGKDDALSQVLGPDPHGLLRGVGYEVTASTLYGVQQYSGRMCELENRYNDVLKELTAVKKILAHVLNNQEPDKSSFQTSSGTFQMCNKSLPTRTPSVAQSNQNLQTPHVARRDHQSLSSQSHRNLNSVGSTKSKVVKCKLFRLVPDDVVAEGLWYADDPTALVHHVPLGLGYSKVSIKVAIQKDALLVRGTTDMNTIEDAVSSFVAWPTSSILML